MIFLPYVGRLTKDRLCTPPLPLQHHHHTIITASSRGLQGRQSCPCTPLMQLQCICICVCVGATTYNSCMPAVCSVYYTSGLKTTSFKFILFYFFQSKISPKCPEQNRDKAGLWGAVWLCNDTVCGPESAPTDALQMNSPFPRIIPRQLCLVPLNSSHSLWLTCNGLTK